MFRRLAFLLVVTLLIPLYPARAQDDKAVYTSEDGTLTFEYPADWVVIPQEDSTSETVMVASASDITDSIDEAWQPGQIQVSVNGGVDPSLFGDDPTSQIPFPVEASIEVQFGYLVGIMTGLNVILAQAFSENPPVATLGTYEELTVGEDRALVFSYELVDYHAHFILLTEGGVYIYAETAPGELEDWRETILDIAASVQYAPAE